MWIINVITPFIDIWRFFVYDWKYVCPGRHEMEEAGGTLNCYLVHNAKDVS